MDHPKVVLNDIERKIVKEEYHRFANTTLTICLLTLQNGTTITGDFACVVPENFDEHLGRHFAREKAVEKIWALEGYLLKETLYQAYCQGSK